MRIVIGVCTYKRPVMLRACLDSLARQEVPKDLSLAIVVVDNEPEADAEHTVSSFTATTDIPVHYVHEPRRGIATARNAILDKAPELAADFIAMIDDDETADARWIAKLLAPGLRGTPIIAGHREFVYAARPSFWEKTRKPKPTSAGAIATANVCFSRALVDAGLRFDEALNLTGGEDNDFFTRAHAMGFAVAHAPDAITYEVIHAERMTYRGLVARHATYVLQGMLRRNDWSGEATKLPLAVLDIFTGAAILAISPVTLLLGKRIFRSTALRGGKHVARGLTRIQFVMGYVPQYYRRIAGH